MKCKIDALDLNKRDVKRLLNLAKELKEEKGAGLCVPIRALRHYDKEKKEWYHDEWQLADDWDGRRKK